MREIFIQKKFSRQVVHPEVYPDLPFVHRANQVVQILRRLVFQLTGFVRQSVADNHQSVVGQLHESHAHFVRLHVFGAAHAGSLWCRVVEALLTTSGEERLRARFA